MQPIVWDADQLWRKAQAYARRALEDNRESWEKPFWSALALEFLTRAALSRTHPVLNADPTQHESVLHALGLPTSGEPRSVPAHSVFIRLEKTIESFSSIKPFCEYFTILRNRELHSASPAFEGLRESDWLAQYYKACDILASHMGQSLVTLFDDDTASAANKMIAALDANIKKAVQDRISSHKKVFLDKPVEEQRTLAAQSERELGRFRAKLGTCECPSCGSAAELRGELERESEPFFRDGELVTKSTFLVNGLKCPACGLALRNMDEVHHAGVEPHFERSFAVDLHEHAQREYEEEYMNM